MYPSDLIRRLQTSYKKGDLNSLFLFWGDHALQYTPEEHEAAGVMVTDAVDTDSKHESDRVLLQQRIQWKERWQDLLRMQASAQEVPSFQFQPSIYSVPFPSTLPEVQEIPKQDWQQSKEDLYESPTTLSCWSILFAYGWAWGGRWCPSCCGYLFRSSSSSSSRTPSAYESLIRRS